jgi:type I restriction enzyme S subunit
MSSNEWENYKLGEIATFYNGRAYKNEEFLSYGTPIIRIQNLTGEGKTVFSDLQLESNKYVNKGDLIFAWSATFGPYIWKGPKSIYHYHIWKIECKEHFLDKNFFYYKLHQITNSLKGGGNGTLFVHITKGQMENTVISIPKIEQQRNIADILKSLDDKIENNLATNQTLEEIARTLFKEWFVNFNYPNADGNLKHSEFGEIPMSWSINGIGEICYVQNGYAFKSKDFQEQGEVGIIKIKNINGNVVDIQNTDFVDASVVSSLDTKFKIESGSLLIAMTGAEVGKIGLVPLTEKNLWLNQRVGMFQEKIAYGNLFMYLLLSTDTYQTAIQNSALGSAQPNISASAIESIRAIIPSAELIESFGKTIKPIFEKILDNLAENETLKTTRDSLLPKLMSGEIEVNG